MTAGDSFEVRCVALVRAGLRSSSGCSAFSEIEPKVASRAAVQERFVVGVSHCKPLVIACLQRRAQLPNNRLERTLWTYAPSLSVSGGAAQPKRWAASEDKEMQPESGLGLKSRRHRHGASRRHAFALCRLRRRIVAPFPRRLPTMTAGDSVEVRCVALVRAGLRSASGCSAFSEIEPKVASRAAVQERFVVGVSHCKPLVIACLQRRAQLPNNRLERTLWTHAPSLSVSGGAAQPKRYT
jgi:hypothetical protein